ncbi:conserved hypothetical protein [Anaeromyxobacter sp. K]|uniref:hypothetical protein n=1 Tax=Anaeromyxobacter sp. (strain K) TaxID=447217 RepID=UPI00015F9A19|nr:hypothetical protein [Anaeromyxobacter sp. K]ACG74981.1 conserved hypothetical protein [Anaeromyxobacter sp. K]
MLRTTQDVVELRRWAEARAARPCREEASGRLALAMPGESCPAELQEVGWEEFEPAFSYSRAVAVYDDAPGGRRCFVGGYDEAHAFVASCRTCGSAGAQDAGAAR